MNGPRIKQSEDKCAAYEEEVMRAKDALTSTSLAAVITWPARGGVSNSAHQPSPFRRPWIGVGLLVECACCTNHSCGRIGLFSTKQMPQQFRISEYSHRRMGDEKERAEKGQ